MHMRPIDTRIKQLDVLPLLKYYMEELSLYGLFDKYVPNVSGCEMAPAQVLCMMVLNLVNAAKPLYQVEEWLEGYLDGVTETRIEAHKYNDDRLARTLDKLFEAERGSLMAEVSKRAMEVHALEVERVHNDTTSITFAGAYERPDGGAVAPRVGFNKDHRPDCKQIVFGLNITADGHVPLSYRLYDGNQADVATHRPNWEALRKFLGTEEFIYVADSKLCALETLAHIAERGGLFITVMPRNFQEVSQFLNRVREGADIDWQHRYEKPNSRKKTERITYLIHEGQSTRDGYRLLWVHSSSKAAQESKARERRLEQAEEKLSALSEKLNAYHLKTREQIQGQVEKIQAGCAGLIRVEILEQRHTERLKRGRGRPGANSHYEERQSCHYRLQWQRDEDAISQARRTDGLFPLVDNTELAPVEVLCTYKQQPYLEKRFHTTKSVLEVAPVFLKTPRRIEAMVFLYFIALMLVSLLERTIRAQMHQEHIESLPIRPSGLSTKAPTWENLQHVFRNVHLAMVVRGQRTLTTSVKGISSLHAQLLRLLKVPTSVYEQLQDGWWSFAARSG
jgi:transposase